MVSDEYYCPHFCEENVYRIAQLLAEAKELTQRSYAVFVSNEDYCCRFAQQKTGRYAKKIVHWDYHVILADFASNLIWDPDSLLSFPSVMSRYLEETFLTCSETERAMFRFIPAQYYLSNFSSARHLPESLADMGIKTPSWHIIDEGNLTLERCRDFKDGGLPSYRSEFSEPGTEEMRYFIDVVE